MPHNPSPDKTHLSKQAEGEIIRDTCKASRIDNITTFAKCETEDPEACRFTLRFPNARLCVHPLVEKIVERSTKTEKLK